MKPNRIEFECFYDASYERNKYLCMDLAFYKIWYSLVNVTEVECRFPEYQHVATIAKLILYNSTNKKLMLR